MPSHGSAALHFAFAERGYSFAQRVYPCVAFAVLRQSFAMLCCHRPAIAALFISMPLPVASTLCDSAAYLFTAVPSLPVASRFVPQQCLRSAILSVTKPLRCQTLLCPCSASLFFAMPSLFAAGLCPRTSMRLLSIPLRINSALCYSASFALPVVSTLCPCCAYQVAAPHCLALPLQISATPVYALALSP